MDGHVSQQVLRDRAGGEQQVTPFELFFDLSLCPP